MSRVLVLSCTLILASHRDAATIECADVSSATASCVMGAGHTSFFVTFCTYRRRSILATKNVHDSFVAFGLQAAQNHNIAVGRYVIMPDHIHLFVCGDLHFHLGKWIKALRQALGKSISSGVRHDRIWQEGFFDHILRSDESMSQKWEYVRDNPVRAGFVRLWTEWPFQGEIVLIDRACL
jgi:putative transposase